jgi:5'-deoxynucleotidase YfbR-like HD superfamily hydrolase
LIERAYEVLEGDLQLGPEAQDGYRKAKKNLERRYANAIDKIDIFMEGLEPFQAARGSARRTTQQALSQARAMAAARQDVIDAVESFQSYFSTLIQQLVRLSRTVG